MACFEGRDRRFWRRRGSYRLSVVLLFAAIAGPPVGALAADNTFEAFSPSPQTSSSFAFELALVDDLSGDGVPDIIVGAPDEDVDVTGDPALESNVGRVYVLSGADRSSVFTLTGDQENARFGFAVAGGDFNADGTPDVAVGASSYSTVANAFAGKAWIFDGTNGSELHSIEGVAVNDFVGADIAFVGNLPRDETFAPDIWGDFVIGAPSNLGTRRVIVVGMEADSPTTSVVVESVITAPNGGNQGATFGSAVGGLDFDDDGTPDVAVGASGASDPSNFSGRGRVYVFSGADLSTQLLFRFGTNHNQEGLGSSVSSAGNFDGQPGAEIAVGASGFEPVGITTSAGAVEVIAYDPNNLAGTVRLRVEGYENNMIFGNETAPAGDVNGDGFDDVLVGQGGASASFQGGNGYILSGGAASGVSESLETSTRRLFRLSDHVALLSGDGAGARGLAGLRDLDADGRPDFVFGATGRGPISEGSVLGFSSLAFFPTIPMLPAGAAVFLVAALWAVLRRHV